jgi:hypothetical protein
VNASLITMPQKLRRENDPMNEHTARRLYGDDYPGFTAWRLRQDARQERKLRRFRGFLLYGLLGAFATLIALILLGVIR